MATELAVWLAPTAKDAAQLRQHIERLAKALGSPPFPPHVTMCTDPAVTTLAAVGPLRELASSLTFTALSFGADYFHGCYLEAKDDATVRELQARCAATLGCTRPEGYPPHLSLAYGVLGAEQRATALALLPELPLRVSFDRLELWASDGPVSGWHQVA